MLEFLKGHFPGMLGKDTGKKEEEKNDLAPQANKNDPISIAPPPSSTAVSTGGLPWDFWPILAKLPFDFGSDDLEQVRKTPEYKALLKQYHLAQPARKKAVEIPPQEQHTNTSIQSLEVLLKDTKLT
tara:strand:+ start:20175 stop:20555 length:381 start_codon:yes stop_codon:yes gene_type:complete